MERRVERVRFAGSTGATLAGLLDRPLEEPRAWAVFAHCFTCSKDAKAAYHVGRTLAERGIAMLRFDVTGLGESEGDFTATDFRTNVEDVVAAAEFLGRTRVAPALLVGHSLGGAACLAAAPRLPAVRLVATIATPSDTASLRARILDQAPELSCCAEEAEVEVGARPVRLGRRTVEGLAGATVVEAAALLGRALLVFHSPDDELLPFAHAERIFAAARQPKGLLALPGAGHLLPDERDARLVGEVLAAWVERG